MVALWLLLFSSEITKLKVLDLLYLSWWASRIKQVDSEGRQLNEDVRLMQLAENLMKTLPPSVTEEHCLHLRLLQIYCKMRIQKDVKQSGPESRRIRKLLAQLRRDSNILRQKCEKTLYCVTIGMLIDEFWVAMLIKMERSDQAVALNSDIRENLESETQFLQNKLIQKQIASITFIQMQLLFSQGDRHKTEILAKKAIKETQHAFGRKPNAYICRAYHFAALCNLTSSEQPSGEQKAKALKYIEKAYEMWMYLIKQSPSNRTHYR